MYKFLRIAIKIVFVIVILGLAGGYYLVNFKDNPLWGHRLIGGAVGLATFVLMPMFLAVRFKGKKLQDYTLTKENIDKMKGKL